MNKSTACFQYNIILHLSIDKQSQDWDSLTMDKKLSSRCPLRKENSNKVVLLKMRFMYCLNVDNLILR